MAMNHGSSLSKGRKVVLATVFFNVRILSATARI